MTDLQAENANLRAALKFYVTKFVDDAQNCGKVSYEDDTWWNNGMSDAEWLEERLGLDHGIRHSLPEFDMAIAGLIDQMVNEAAKGTML